MESGSLWDLLPRLNKASQRPFQFQHRHASTVKPIIRPHTRQPLHLMPTQCTFCLSTHLLCIPFEARVPYLLARSSDLESTAVLKAEMHVCRGKKIAYEVALGLHFTHEIK